MQIKIKKMEIKGDTSDVSSVLLIKKDADVEKLLRNLDATLLNTLEFEHKKYIVVKGMNRTIEEVQRLSEVHYAEPDYERHLFAAPDDTYYTSQYAPQITDLEQVWASGYTGDGVVVAVIDTGVNTLHEDFEGASAFVAGYDYSTRASYGTTTHNDADGHGRVQAVEALEASVSTDVSFTRLEFKLSPFSPTNPITILDSSNNIIGSLVLGDDGEGAMYLPATSAGINYTYTTEYYGANYTGSVTLTNEDMLISKTFTNADLSNQHKHYRISTFYVSDSADTIINFYRYDGAGDKYDIDNYSFIKVNDDKSATDEYSEVRVRANSGDRVLFLVYGYDENETGYYQVVLDQDIFGASKNSADYVSGLSDATNSGTSSVEEIELTLDEAKQGYISLDDFDFFFYDVP